MNSATVNSVYRYLFEYLLSILLGIHLEVELLGHIVIDPTKIPKKIFIRVYFSQLMTYAGNKISYAPENNSRILLFKTKILLKILVTFF